MANAFYHRASRSLQFFYFDGVIADEETTVYTCLSPDIVAHERPARTGVYCAQPRGRRKAQPGRLGLGGADVSTSGNQQNDPYTL